MEVLNSGTAQNNWTDVGNWDNQSGPNTVGGGSYSDNIFFGRDGGAGGILSNMDQASTRVRTLRFVDGHTDLRGGIIGIGVGIVSNQFDHTIRNYLSLDGTTNDLNVGGTLRLTGTVRANGVATKNGVGNLILSGTNEFTNSGLVVKSGTVTLASDSALGADKQYDQDTYGDLTLAGGAVQAGDYSAYVKNLTFGDGLTTSTGTINGTKTLFLYGAVTYLGLPNGTTNSAVVNTKVQLSEGLHGIQSNGSESACGGYDLLFKNVVSGFGGLQMNTSPNFVMALAAQNTYSGGTEVVQGTLAIGVSDALPTNTALTLNGTFLMAPTVAQSGIVPGDYSQTIGSLAGTGQIRLGSRASP